jgi:uracil-DNA glycosylase
MSHPRGTVAADQARLATLLEEVRACRICAEHLPLGPKPVLRASATARVLIAGQAPGTKVHLSGLPWNDASGDRLRHWLGLDRDTFYDERRIAIVPMAFCYPGSGKSGDNPPRPECRATWHPRLLPALPNTEVHVLAGQYAIAYHLGERRKESLTATVRAWRDYAPRHFPLPHPSWHNTRWLKQNPWFEAELVPVLRRAVRERL